MLKLLIYLIRIAVNINLYINLRSVCVSQLLDIYIFFDFNRIDWYMCKKTKFLTFHLTVKIDLVEVFYYLTQVFHLLFDKSTTLAEPLLYFSLIS